MLAVSICRRPASRATFLALIAAAIAACQNPLTIAQTPEQKYAAVLLTYDALLTPAAEVVGDQTLPASVRSAVQQAVAASATIYKSADQAYVAYIAARAQLAAGATTSDKLNIASSNLDAWLKQLESSSNALATLLKH